MCCSGVLFRVSIKFSCPKTTTTRYCSGLIALVVVVGGSISIMSCTTTTSRASSSSSSSAVLPNKIVCRPPHSAIYVCNMIYVHQFYLFLDVGGLIAQDIRMSISSSFHEQSPQMAIHHPDTMSTPG